MKNSLPKTVVSRFKTIAISEGISFLVLLFIAMPLKYFGNLPQMVLIVGWVHGFLFIAYMISLLQVKMVHRWSFNKAFIAAAAALIPFGPFVLEKKILKEEAE